MPEPRELMTWDPARGVWTTPEHLLCGHSARYSETWPSSGSMRSGRVFARPISVPRTDGSGSSSSPGLPTPTTRDHKGQNQRGDDSCLTGALLPTPRTSDTNGAGSHGDGGPDLRTVASTLLPTPRATDGTKGGPNQGGSSGDLMLPSAVQLLPTPRSQNGEERNQNIWARPLDQPQNLKNALARLEDE